jgi:hypothetical protein
MVGGTFSDDTSGTIRGDPTVIDRESHVTGHLLSNVPDKHEGFGGRDTD